MMCFTIGLIIAEMNTPVASLEALTLQQIALNSYSTQVVVYAVGIGIVYVAEIIYDKIVDYSECMMTYMFPPVDDDALDTPPSLRKK